MVLIKVYNTETKPGKISVKKLLKWKKTKKIFFASSNLKENVYITCSHFQNIVPLDFRIIL